MAAFYNVIRDLSRHQNASDMLVKDYFLTTLPALQQKQVANWINSFENFFKHADHDPNHQIELNPELTELMLIDAWVQYEKLTGILPVAGKIFKIWTGKSKDNASDELKYLTSLFKNLSKQELYDTFSKATLANI